MSFLSNSDFKKANLDRVLGTVGVSSIPVMHKLSVTEHNSNNSLSSLESGTCVYMYIFQVGKTCIHKSKYIN